MSFIGVMKDKRGASEGPNVFHRGDEGQKEGVQAAKCPSWG
ncbi:UNVERIFIED_ORG: hypothetical protein ABRZ91_001649 [Heyndrickxia coagulans]